MPYDDYDQQEDNKKYPPAKALTETETAALVSQFHTWTEQQIGRIYRDAGGWCGADDLAKFLYICEKRNLDPLLGEIHAEFRWDRRNQRFNLAPISHIDGIRKVADTTKQYDGQDDPVFAHDAKGELVSCTVHVFRKDCTHPFGAICFLKEYRGPGLWNSKPHVMLAKVTEMAALRKAFPAALAGVYIPEEFDRSDDEPAAAPPVEDFAVGQKHTATATPPPPAKEEALQPPKPPLGGVPGGASPPPPTHVPSELDGSTSKRMADIKNILQKAGKLDAPNTTKALHMFLRDFFGVSTLPKDAASYQAPLAALEAMTPTDIEALAKDPLAASKRARQPLEEAFDHWHWTIELCALAKNFIRAKAMSYPYFVTWMNETGASKLTSEDDVGSFLSLALVTPKAYMILQLDRAGKSVGELIKALGGIDHFKSLTPDEAAAHIGAAL